MNKKLLILLYSLIGLTAFCTTSPEQQEKTAVFIIGAGRCGSSCITGILQILGLYLGSPLREGDDNNPNGYFEHIPFMILDHYTLEEFGTHYYDITPFSLNTTTPLFKKQKNVYKNYLQQFFGDAHQFGIKNGRITLLLPLYVHAAQELGFKVKVIAAMRNPEEIAESYAKLEIPKETTLALVQKFYALIEEYQNQYDLIKIEFNDLLFTTRATVQKITTFLPFLKSYDETKDEITNFLDASLKHHNKT